MEPEVALSSEIIRQVREDHSLKLAVVAMRTGWSRSAIDRYELGLATVPPEYLASLFRITRDWRIAQIVLPGLQPCRCSTSVQRLPPTGDPRDLLPKLISALDEALACMKYCERIVRDGAVNEADDHLLGKFDGHVNRCTDLQTQTSRALHAWREDFDRTGRTKK